MTHDEQGRRIYSSGFVSSYFDCPTCREFTTYKNHKCAPLWYVADLEIDDKDIVADGGKYYANDAQKAAEKYFSWSHSGMDYPDEADYIVSDLNGENITYWKVVAELVLEFNTEKLDKRPQ